MKKIILLSVLFSVFSMAAAPFLYITNGEGGPLTVVDVATNEIIATIPANTSFDVVVNPTGTRAYFTDEGDSLVYVIDTATNTVITTIPLDSPNGLAITHDGKTLYVTNDNAITPIDTATNTAGSSILGFTEPTDITISPDDRIAYVANSGVGTVIPVDLATGTLGTPIVVADFPRAIKISPNGQTVYVTSTNGTLTVISTATNTVTAAIALTPGLFLEDVEISFDSRIVYVAGGGSDTLFILNAGTNAVIAAISTSSPSGLVLDPCGQILYIGNLDAGTVTPLFTATNTLGTSFAAGPSPFRLAITPIIDVQGRIIRNTFLNKIELVLKLNWHVLPITNAAFFRIFQNGVVVGQIFAGSRSNTFVVCLSPNFVCHSSSEGSTDVELGLFAASGVEITRIPITTVN